LRRPFQGTVVALRGGCQQTPLGIGQFHGILHSVAATIAAATTEMKRSWSWFDGMSMEKNWLV
jgi:hypothetical protein